MMDRQKGRVIFECDSCGTIHDSDNREFQSAWDEARAEGWKAKKIGTDWMHACAECKID